jgi:transposase
VGGERAQQKSELVLASLRGPLRGRKTIAELCREHEISETLFRRWREQFLAAGAERLSGKAERSEADELRRQVRQLERALGRKTLEVEVARNSCGAGSECARRPVPRARRARPPCGRRRPRGRVSRQAIYRRPARRPKGHRRALSHAEKAILGVARENPTTAPA